MTNILMLILLGVTAVFSRYTGFGHTNHVEQIPYFYRMLDPTFLKNDWATNEVSQGFNVRWTFNALVAVVNHFTGSLENSYLIILTFAIIIFLIYSWKIARLVSVNPIFPFLFVFLLLYATLYSLGGNEFISWYLIPSALANPLVVMATYLFLTKRHTVSLLLLAIVTYIHLQVGLQFFLLFGIATFFLFIRYRQAIPWVAYSLYLGIVLPLLCSGFGSGSISSQRAVDILARYRAPWHFLPSSFDHSAYLLTILLIMISLLILKKYTHTLEHKLAFVLTSFIFSITGFFIIGYVFVELIPIKYVLFMQFFRYSPVLFFLANLVISFDLSSSLKKLSLTALGSALIIFALISPYFVFNALMLVGYLLSLTRDVWSGSSRLLKLLCLFGCATAIVIFFSLISHHIPFSGYSILAVPSWTILPPALLLLAIVLLRRSLFPVFLTFIIINFLLLRSYPLYNRYIWPSEEKQLYATAKTLTDPDSIFVIPTAQLMGFRLFAQRAVVVDWKSDPFKDSSLEEYYQRNMTINDLYLHPSLPKLKLFSEKYHVSYLIDSNRTPAFATILSHPIYSNIDYTIYRLNF